MLISSLFLTFTSGAKAEEKQINLSNVLHELNLVYLRI